MDFTRRSISAKSRGNTSGGCAMEAVIVSLHESAVVVGGSNCLDRWLRRDWREKSDGALEKSDAGRGQVVAKSREQQNHGDAFTPTSLWRHAGLEVPWRLFCHDVIACSCTMFAVTVKSFVHGSIGGPTQDYMAIEPDAVKGPLGKAVMAEMALKAAESMCLDRQDCCTDCCRWLAGQGDAL
ncbi:hypothetical protein IAQ61_011988 [Plenodomus lingam]|uniref:uncharacterized protein n=1 Tax=Leptosphaeria maculans TaxID=5022 RepID=UPI00332487FD|nr:hypothetical protein IAQ61_011988 [Plenodomus lingam]